MVVVINVRFLSKPNCWKFMEKSWPTGNCFPLTDKLLWKKERKNWINKTSTWIHNNRNIVAEFLKKIRTMILWNRKTFRNFKFSVKTWKKKMVEMWTFYRRFYYIVNGYPVNVLMYLTKTKYFESCLKALFKIPWNNPNASYSTVPRMFNCLFHCW